MENLLNRYNSLEVCDDDIENAPMLILDTYKNSGKVLVCGNGGSAADSEPKSFSSHGKSCFPPYFKKVKSRHDYYAIKFEHNNK